MSLSVATTLAYYILVQASMVKSITESYCSAFISICCYAAQEAKSSTDFITGSGAFRLMTMLHSLQISIHSLFVRNVTSNVRFGVCLIKPIYLRH